VQTGTWAPVEEKRGIPGCADSTRDDGYLLRGEDALGFSAFESVSHRGEELGVFNGTTDRDADRFGKTHPAERTDNDAFEKEFVTERFGMSADGDEEEIGFTGDGREAESAESVVEALPLLAIDFDGATDVFGVIESSECGRLADIGDIEGSAKLVHFGDKGGVSNAVADAEPREAVHFGKSAEGEDVVVLAEELGRVGEIGSRRVFAIGLVENDENVTRNFFEESRKFGGPEGCAGGIVGVGNIDYAGLRVDRGGHGVEVEGEILHRNLDEVATTGANGDREESEGAFTGDAIEAGTKKNARSEVNDLAGTEADKDFFGANVEAIGEDLAETLAAAIGIPVGFAKSAASGSHGLRGGPERIFVGSEFDGVDLEVLLDFFDGLAGHVGGEALDVIGDKFFESVSHKYILCPRLGKIEGWLEISDGDWWPREERAGNSRALGMTSVRTVWSGIAKSLWNCFRQKVWNAWVSLFSSCGGGTSRRE
jgi:hypothetical protein